MHEVTRHLKSKAHRVVLPHRFHHASLIVLQEEDPRVIYVLVTPGLVTMPWTSSQSTVAIPGFLLTGRNVPLMGTETQEPRVYYFLEVHPLWKKGKGSSTCTWLRHSTGATFRKGSSRTFRGLLVAHTGADRTGKCSCQATQADGEQLSEAAITATLPSPVRTPPCRHWSWSRALWVPELTAAWWVHALLREGGCRHPASWGRGELALYGVSQAPYTLQGAARLGAVERFPGQAWHSVNERPEVWKRLPQGLTCVMLITSLTNAIALSGWNLHVPFCADGKWSVPEPPLHPPLQTRAPAARQYLSPVRVGVLPHQPFVIHYVFESLAWQAPAKQHSQHAD